MICGCSAVTVKFDTAVRNQVFGNVWFGGYKQARHPHVNKNAQAWRLFQKGNQTADDQKQRNISRESFPKIVAAE